MRRLGSLLVVAMTMMVTMAACGTDVTDSDVSPSEQAITAQYTYWKAGTKTTWNGGGRTMASCGDGDMMLGLSLGTPPQILCGVLPPGSVLNASHKYAGASTRDGVFPSCSGSTGYSDVAMSWQIDYPAFKTTVQCASSFYWQPGNSYVDDLQGHGSFTDSFGRTFSGHRCSRAGSYVVGYNGDHDLLDCAY